MSLKDDAAYLRSIGFYIGLSVFIFAAMTVMGYLAASSNSELAMEMTKELELLKWIMSLPSFMIMTVIFLKNLLACAMSVLFGLGLGIVPFLVVTSNGFLLGVVAYGVLNKEGFLFLLAGILPHGIIELPTVLVSIAIGFRLGYLLTIAILGEKPDLIGEIRTAVHILIRFIMPLLLLAAFTETYITPIALSVVK
ncbi:MAG: stage II sporulation protein M [Methanotrichaceae archaeon]|nr:stage II sporulation protein M [Methanotrichaceae archaeon]